MQPNSHFNDPLSLGTWAGPEDKCRCGFCNGLFSESELTTVSVECGENEEGIVYSEYRLCLNCKPEENGKI